MDEHKPENQEENRQASRDNGCDEIEKALREWGKKLWIDFAKASQTAKFWIELFALIGLGIYTTFAALQWRETRKAVISAEDANKIARDTLTANQRAYVTVTGLDIQPVPGEPAFWRALPIVVNNGNTSTKNMWWTSVARDSRGYQYWLQKTIDQPEGPLLQTFTDLQGATRNTMSLGPRQENRSLSLSQPIPLQYINGIKARTTTFYIHGVFFYQDFLSPQGHVTRYCYTLWYNPAITGPSDIAYATCGGKTNCADEECEDYEHLKTLAVPIAK
jgi:hypothetical protein